MLAVEPSVLGAFVIAVAAIVVSPGPDTLIILRSAPSSGRGAGFAAVTGVQFGLLVHTLLAVLGLSLIVASSPTLLRVIAVAGAAYLAFLGVRGLGAAGAHALDVNRPPIGVAEACRDGALTNLLNPKVIALFLALFPNFVDPGRGHVPGQLATLAVTLIVVNTLWQAPMAWAAARARRWLAEPVWQRRLSRLSGAALLAFAGAMLLAALT